MSPTSPPPVSPPAARPHLPAVQRILSADAKRRADGGWCGEWTPAECAPLLNVQPDFVRELCRCEQIEHLAASGSGSGEKPRYSISTRGLIDWVLRNTRGPHDEAMAHTIERHARHLSTPHLSALQDRITELLARRGALPAPRVITPRELVRVAPVQTELFLTK